MEFLKNFARQHVVGTIFTCAGMFFTGASGVAWTLYEQSVNRVEEMKVSEFNELMAENGKFLEMLNAFTEEVGQDDKIDPVKRRELSASLSRLYTKYGNFSVNMPSTADASIKKLQTSLNNVKKQVQTMKVKSDLDPLGVSLVIMFRDMKSLKPYLEQSVGKPVAING
ncbi:hypothetical protein [Agrobacterium tumefaciens]|uniref:hypothetical protein n=1 Tax=Agrobacterium tumefaciens TaxID=358 RepID=UPI001AE4E624|nr:hypothetical protein [Agrobacterium tumefaciens]MBP2534096.1 hypothetical protein [Agrobacterium tumefaciens]